MPLPIPNLDDRTFDQLVAEARALIPKNFPAWTDHNLSDPGIMLLELFAFLIEISIYQINRVPERSLEHFAELVGVTRRPGELIEQTLRRALEELQLKYRAITEGEFETLVKDDFERLVVSSATAAEIPEVNLVTFPDIIARARAVVEVIDTPNVFPDEQFVNVIIVPNDPNADAPKPSDKLRQKVFEFLRARRLITTRVRVVSPTYDRISIRATVVRDLGSHLDKETAQRGIERAIRNFLSPLTGGAGGTGWEFGRSVFRSELYQIIEGIPGVDHVRQLLLNGDEAIGEAPLGSRLSLVKLDNFGVTMLDT
jgi:hypothetical protein